MTDLNQLPDPSGNPTGVLPKIDDNDSDDLVEAEAYAALKQRRAERQKKKIRRRIIAGSVVGGIVLIAVVATMIMSHTNSANAEIEPVVDYALQGTYSTEISANGSLKAKSSTVVSPVDGIIETLNVVEGQTVAEGEILLTVKNDELDQAVTTAQYELDDAQNDLNTKWSAYQESGDSADKREYELAIRTRDSKRTALEQAQAQADARTVRAPHAGNIVELNAQVGATISGGTIASSDGSGSKSVMQIADLSQMRVTVSVDEQDIAKIKEGQSASITFSAFDDLIEDGQVQSIASIANSSGDYYDGSSGAQFNVEILIPAPDSKLKPGMTAAVNIVTEQFNDVVMVPVMALKTNDGAQYYVDRETDAETHTSERVEVTVYAENDSYAVVGRPQGITPNDLVVASMDEAPLNDGDILIISSVDEINGSTAYEGNSSSDSSEAGSANAVEIS